MQKNDQWNYYLYRKAWRFSGLPHEEQKLSKEACNHLLREGGLFIRNTYAFDQKEENGFWYLIKDTFTPLEELPSKRKVKIKKALNLFDFQLVDKKVLYDNDFVEHYKQSFDLRQERYKQDYIDDFFYYLQQENCEYWACFAKETHDFAGFAINTIADNACEYKITCILPKYHANAYYTYYGLFHAMNEYYLGQRHFKYVTDGSRTITEHSGIQDYLIQNFNFRKAYCQLEIHYQWWMKIAVKMLYPFRNIVKSPRVKAVLNMEAMRRGEK